MATNKDFIVKNGLSVGEDISVSGSVTSHLQFDDGIQLQLGTDGDLLLYHTGGNSYIDSQTINLVVDAPLTTIKDGADVSATFDPDGAVGLYNAGDIKLLTTSTGVDITGNAVLTGELRGPASFVIDPAAVGDNTGEVVIKGDLTVEGTTTTINSTTLTVDDLNIVLASGASSASAADGAGITVDGAAAKLEYDSTQDRWNMNKGLELIGSPLVVGTGATDVGRIENSSGVFSMYAYTTRQIAFGNDTNGEHVRIDANGQVGIGVNVPTVALDVSGDITATGTITGADFSGITMGGSLSGSHDDAKVQYGTAFSGTPAQGHFFFDSLNQKLKVYTGSAFVDAVPASGGGGGGSGSSDATATFRKYTYTLTATTNAISGKEDDEVTTGDFISGRLYEITVVGDTNFTSIGASSNTVGVQFTATDVGDGTTGKAKEVLFYATGGTQNIEVYVNGVKAVEGASNDYVATTGTSITFTSNLSSGDVVDVQVYELLTQDSFYLKTETYTQNQILAGFVAKSGDTMTGNLNVGSSGANALFTAYGGAAARPTFIHSSGYGGLQLAGTGAGSGPSLIFSNNWTNGVSEEYSIFLDGATDDLVFISGDPADVASEERMRLTDDGKLGINTSAPTSMLEIKTTNQNFDDGVNAIRIVHPAGPTTGDVGGGIVFAQRWYASSTQDVRTGGIYGIKTHGSGAFGGGLAFYTQPANANDMNQVMVLTDDKYVGIGTDTPDTVLEIRAADPVLTIRDTDTGSATGNATLRLAESGASDSLDQYWDITATNGQLEFRDVWTEGAGTGHNIIFSDAGHILPGANAAQDLGSSTLAWRNIYTNDLHLSNEGHEEGNSVDGTKGNWTIQEGEEHLYIINNKSGKKYKFALEEIE